MKPIEFKNQVYSAKFEELTIADFEQLFENFRRAFESPEQFVRATMANVRILVPNVTGPLADTGPLETGIAAGLVILRLRDALNRFSVTIDAMPGIADQYVRYMDREAAIIDDVLRSEGGLPNG